ncbi:hypothetical protein GCM10027058_29270 [Microbacterium neimengense]
MPRLTTRDYLTTRHFLAGLWIRDTGSTFASLPANAQRDLHDFYAPAVAMSDDEALEYRKAMTAAFHSLPHSAGRAVVALRASLNGLPNQILDRYKVRASTQLSSGRRTRVLRVLPVAKPQLDEYHLVKVIEHLWRDDDSYISKRPKS